MKNIHILVILILLAACSTGKEKDKAVVETEETDVPDLVDSVDEVVSNGEMLNKFVEKGDSITIPEFEIEIVLSDRAEKKLVNEKETIIVQAYFTGLPKEGVTVELTEMDELPLASPHVELKDSRIARFSGVNIAKAHFNMLQDEDFQILINVFSGRRSSELNLLDSDILEEPISKTRGKRHRLRAKLIEE